MLVPFRPSAPRAPAYLSDSGAWILSRYTDVSRALNATELSQSHITDSQQEAAAHASLKAAVQADVQRLTAEQWHLQAAESMRALIACSRRKRQLDLVADIIQPWVAKQISDLNVRPDCSERLTIISKELLLATVSKSKGQTKVCERAIDDMIEDGSVNLSRPMFFGFTQTLPTYLSKGCLALLLHPATSQQLLTDSALMDNAAEELLRYAGVVHTIHRIANSDVEIGTASISRGETVLLQIDSANFDPEKFHLPNQLDFVRGGAGHLGLGRGLHSCVGSFLVRMASCAALPELMQAGLALDPTREAVWASNRTLLWPASVPVTWAHD